MKLEFNLKLYSEHPGAKRTKTDTIAHIINPKRSKEFRAGFENCFAWLNKSATKRHAKGKNRLLVWVPYKVKKL